MKSKKKLNVIILILTLILISTSVFVIKSDIKLSSNISYENEYTTKEKPIPKSSNSEMIICNINNADKNLVFHCSDEIGGIIIVWSDNRSGSYDLYAQRINSTGDICWEPNGTLICDVNKTHSVFPFVCCDGVGGIIVAWDNMTTDFLNTDIYAQRINISGNVLWGSNGEVISSASGHQSIRDICSDGIGGAIIVWDDTRFSGSRFGQRINSSGVCVWNTDGTPIKTGVGGLGGIIELCSDGLGGAIVSWIEGDFNNVDIYSQRIDHNGVLKWTTEGVVICNDDNVQILWGHCSDKLGGAYIIWRDNRSVHEDIYGQRINSEGKTLWIDNGTAICSATEDQRMAICSSSDLGNLLVVWADERGIVEDLYAQKVDRGGKMLWAPNGSLICNSIGEKDDYFIINDRSEGAIIVWTDERNGNYDIYSQHLDAEGNNLWNANGKAICTDSSEQNHPRISLIGIDSVFITWIDERNGLNDIYGRIIDFSEASTPITVIIEEDDDDSDNETTVISFGNYYISFLIIGIISLIYIINRKSSQKKKKY